jgi:multidrug efflux pump
MGEEKEDTSLIFTVVGQNAQGSGQNTGRGFLALQPWDERSGEKHSADAITRRSTTELSRQLRDVEFFAMNPPSVRGLGQSGGFTMQLLNTGGLDRATFRARADELLAKARANQNLNAVRLNSLPDVPTLAIDIDSVKAGALGVSQADINTTLSTVLGGGYVNDWIDRGRVKRVYVQGDAPFRARPEDLGSWFIRNGSGTMTSLSTFSNSRWSVAPSVLTRFNGNPSFEIQGQAAEGESTGTAMDEISKLAADIPGTKIAWSGVSYQERMAGNQSWILYGISLLVVFLFLAALYESWSIPIAVMLVIPLGLAGAALAVMMRGLANDIFFQIGLVTTMGLSAKNAILIVEFAEQAERAGKSAVEAALEAARIRLRPIVMTSLAFIFGVLPLCIATGPGAKSRIEIGTAVIGGMIAATALAIFYIPLFFVLVRKIFGVRHGTHGIERCRGGDMGETEVPA